MSTRHPSVADPETLVLETIREHAASLLATARRYSLCPDDANDAYQRAVEIFLRRAHRLDPDGAVGWLRTVVKHEAFAVRASRQRLLAGGDVDLEEHPASPAGSPEDRAADADCLTRSAEALQRLKPQEVRALLLKAQGHSYREICELTGWSYTKVNRCLTEGRRSFLDRYAGIEAGRECERWESVLSAIADGEASSEDLIAVRPHLRNCPGCRAALRDFRTAPATLAALVPVAGVALGTGAGSRPAGVGGLARIYDALFGGASDRLALSVHKLQAGLEATSSTKLAAVAVSATALGGGVVAVDGPSTASGQRSAHRAAPARHAHSARAMRVARFVTGVAARDGAGAVPRSDATGAHAPAASPSTASRTAAPSGRQTEFGFEGDPGGASPTARASRAGADPVSELGGSPAGVGGAPSTGDSADSDAGDGLGP